MPVREEILRLLPRLSELTPDVRFGQLIANLSYQAVGPTAEAVWDMEDEQLLEAIRKHIADLSERSAEVVGRGRSGGLRSLKVDWQGRSLGWTCESLDLG